MPLEVIYIIGKFQEAFPGVHKFHKINNWSCELQNWLSSAREELHLQFYGGLSNGLAQVRYHSI